MVERWLKALKITTIAGAALFATGAPAVYAGGSDGGGGRRGPEASSPQWPLSNPVAYRSLEKDNYKIEWFPGNNQYRIESRTRALGIFPTSTGAYEGLNEIMVDCQIYLFRDITDSTYPNSLNPFRASRLSASVSQADCVPANKFSPPDS